MSACSQYLTQGVSGQVWQVRTIRFGPPGLALDSRRAVARLGLGTGSRLALLDSQRSAVQFPSIRCAYLRPSLRFGPPGIEPGLHPPHGCVLPVYYGPSSTRVLVGPLGIEPSLHAPEACVLPVYDGPAKNLVSGFLPVHPSGFEPETFRM